MMKPMPSEREEGSSTPRKIETSLGYRGSNFRSLRVRFSNDLV